MNPPLLEEKLFYPIEGVPFLDYLDGLFYPHMGFMGRGTDRPRSVIGLVGVSVKGGPRTVQSHNYKNMQTVTTHP